MTVVLDIFVLSYREVFEEATSSHANRLATKGESSKVAPVLEALVKQDEKLQKTLKKGIVIWKDIECSFSYSER